MNDYLCSIKSLCEGQDFEMIVKACCKGEAVRKLRKTYALHEWDSKTIADHTGLIGENPDPDEAFVCKDCGDLICDECAEWREEQTITVTICTDCGDYQDYDL